MGKNSLTLVIMAAGMGTRFGGLKQIEPVGPNQEFIIDYSIYDAIKIGFGKVVFIIKEENYDIFRNTIGKRFEDKIKVEYVFQRIDDIPDVGCKLEKRVKPWGTAHAIWSVRNNVKGNFVVINADDFYGRESYQVAYEFFENKNDNENIYFTIGYKAENTLTEYGAAKRGVCMVKGNCLERVVESSVEKKNGKIIAEPVDSTIDSFVIEEDTFLSMNMLGLTPQIFEYMEDDIKKFLIKNKGKLETVEYQIPDVLNDNAQNDIVKIKVIPTPSKWIGVTYREDKESVVKEIHELVSKGMYPSQI